MQIRCLTLHAIIVSVLLLTGGCLSNTPAPNPSASDQPVINSTNPSPFPPGAFSVRVASLESGAVLPDLYSCKGGGQSPAVSWDGVPPGTKSLALILDDPDAPDGGFTHWIVYNIPPKSEDLAQAQPNAKVLANGAQQGATSAGSRGYYAPCPPIGETHRYIFRLYAVDMDITQPTADRESIDWALTGHTIAETEFLTTVKR